MIAAASPIPPSCRLLGRGHTWPHRPWIRRRPPPRAPAGTPPPPSGRATACWEGSGRGAVEWWWPDCLGRAGGCPRPPGLGRDEPDSGNRWGRGIQGR
ncbi:hypothetical protein GQ55_2G156600 [Panicum hallii var. hallii]|uniref:Uncharacterized protein n=1 Tax=Panicum hallii var. hallii TaxID=1504633 RepID=A0A2T7EPV3_9POAL|nr:hypothetical protein GQ55_2G156600 [Panicum hallii var. hallii]